MNATDFDPPENENPTESPVAPGTFDSGTFDSGTFDSGTFDQLVHFAKLALPREVPPDRFERYLLREPLSRSGTSFVFRASDPPLNRSVVLKIGPPDSHRDQDVLAEGRALATIDNDHVVRVLTSGEVDSRPFLVLEDIEGTALDQFARHHAISERLVLGFAIQIAIALRDVHANGLLHLDLKPGNIIVTAGPAIKLIDFGLARRFNEVSFDEIMGTPAYLAPERANDRPAQIGRPTDIFGVGGIMFFLLTGQTPFDGETTDEVLLHSMQGRINVEAWRDLRVSRATRRLVELCLAGTPELRPQTAEELINRINRIRFGKGLCILFWILICIVGIWLTLVA